MINQNALNIEEAINALKYIQKSFFVHGVFESCGLQWSMVELPNSTELHQSPC
jgi:hypothetical protein